MAHRAPPRKLARLRRRPVEHRVCPRSAGARQAPRREPRHGGPHDETQPAADNPGIAARRRALLALVALALATAAGSQERPPYLDTIRQIDARIEDVMARLTLEEKVGLVHANGKFRAGGVRAARRAPPVDRRRAAGRARGGGLDSWEPAGWTSDFATAMPAGMALASTWDTELAEAYGRVVGEEARARGKHVILGPALNIRARRCAAAPTTTSARTHGSPAASRWAT